MKRKIKVNVSKKSTPIKVNKTKEKYPIDIIETGEDWMEHVETIYELAATLDEAFDQAEQAGYKVMHDDDGGHNYLTPSSNTYDYHWAVTVYPEKYKQENKTLTNINTVKKNWDRFLEKTKVNPITTPTLMLGVVKEITYLAPNGVEFTHNFENTPFFTDKPYDRIVIPCKITDNGLENI